MNMLTRRPSSVFNLLNGIDIPYFDFVWGDSNAGQPKVDIQEKGDSFILEAELPGISEKDIDIKVDNNQLTISATQEEQKKSKQEGKDGQYLIRERRASSTITRSFALADSVDTANISASFKNGLLRLVAPKKEKEQSRAIKVQAA